MARKKKTTNIEAQPKSTVAKKSDPPAPIDDKKGGASSKTILAMGLAGAFLGFLSGLNQWPHLPVELNTPAASAAWLGAVLGVQHLDFNSAFQGGFLGLTVGLGFASSFNFTLRKMLLAWLLASYGRQAWRALLPTALASGLALALIGLLDEPLQLFNMLALLLVLGMGVDYGIFLLAQPQRDGYRRAAPVVAQGVVQQVGDGAGQQRRVGP